MLAQAPACSQRAARACYLHGNQAAGQSSLSTRQHRPRAPPLPPADAPPPSPWPRPADTCALLSELYEGLDNSYICPSPAAIKAIASTPVVWVNGTASPMPSTQGLPVVIVNATASG